MSKPSIQAQIGDVAYQVTLSNAHHQWMADELQAVGGGDTGPNPKELLLSSLAACTAITLKMYAARKQWPLREVKLQLSFDAADQPGTATRIVRQIELLGDLDDEQRRRLMQVADACPVHKILTGQIDIVSRLEAAL